MKCSVSDVIVGVDEAGRGTWAGPIFAAAAAVPTDWKPPSDVRDSKKLSRSQMEAVQKRYAQHDRVLVSVEMIPPDIIDQIGLDRAQALAQGNAIRGVIKQMGFSPPLVVVDGISAPAIEDWEVGQIRLIPKADALIPAVSLASIFAKVSQVKHMQELDIRFPEYGFSKSCGYGTKAHQKALSRHGPCIAHRRSFGPVAKIIDFMQSQDIQNILGDIEENDDIHSH
jgi:ribonuclease HII